VQEVGLREKEKEKKRRERERERESGGRKTGMTRDLG